MTEEGPPSLDELVHYGKKGMKWGVVNEDPLVGRRPGTATSSVSTTTTRSSVSVGSRIESSSQYKKSSKAKKAAIGVGIVAATVGGGYVAYKLNQSGTLPLSQLKSDISQKGKSLSDGLLKKNGKSKKLSELPSTKDIEHLTGDQWKAAFQQQKGIRKAEAAKILTNRPSREEVVKKALDESRAERDRLRAKAIKELQGRKSLEQLKAESLADVRAKFDDKYFENLRKRAESDPAARVVKSRRSRK